MFPARAGMNRRLSKVNTYKCPRTCGDEPLIQVTDAPTYECSPHVRDEPRLVAVPKMFPARAGMNR